MHLFKSWIIEDNKKPEDKDTNQQINQELAEKSKKLRDKSRATSQRLDELRKETENLLHPRNRDTED